MSSLEINPKEFFEEFQKPQDVECLLKNLTEQFNSNELSLCDFIIFLFKNNLLKIMEQIGLFLVVFLLCVEGPYWNHLSLIATILLDREQPVCVVFLQEVLLLDKVD